MLSILGGMSLDGAVSSTWLVLDENQNVCDISKQFTGEDIPQGTVSHLFALQGRKLRGTVL